MILLDVTSKEWVDHLNRAVPPKDGYEWYVDEETKTFGIRPIKLE